MTSSSTTTTTSNNINDPILDTSILLFGAAAIGFVVLGIIFLKRRKTMIALHEPSIKIDKDTSKKSPREVSVFRGGEIVGGKFDYKVKVLNNTDFVINNVTITIIAYPEDCMVLSGSAIKTLKRIEPDGFRSPQFTFRPTKDCVEGEIIATVSYMDHQNHAVTLSAEPYRIRSVCDLLKPLESSLEEFDAMLCPVNQLPAIEHGTSWDNLQAFNNTFCAKHAGLPSGTVRCGTSSGGLPIGVQVIGSRCREDIVLAVLKFLEDEFGGWKPPPEENLR